MQLWAEGMVGGDASSLVQHFQLILYLYHRFLYYGDVDWAAVPGGRSTITKQEEKLKLRALCRLVSSSLTARLPQKLSWASPGHQSHWWVNVELCQSLSLPSGFCLVQATFQLTDVKDQVPEEFVSKLMGGSWWLTPWVAGKVSGMPRALRISLPVYLWGQGAELSRICWTLQTRKSEWVLLLALLCNLNVCVPQGPFLINDQKLQCAMFVFLSTQQWVED